jgi:ubiquinone/menaquinone biosynthesis C-methylase UbiE
VLRQPIRFAVAWRVRPRKAPVLDLGIMATHESGPDYLLGYADEEHERLIRQAARLVPIAEGFFREAGISAGQRVLDVGSGVGDVAMLLAKLVGPTGEVVGIERDGKSVARATTRASAARLRHLTFVQGDAGRFFSDRAFDAVVGRFILQFLPHPAAILQQLLKSVRPGGIVAFQENSWAPFVLLSAHVPLCAVGVRLLHEVSTRHGVNMEMGPALFRTFQDAGLPAPRMRLQMELGHDADFTRWVSDAVRTLEPLFRKYDISIEVLGDLENLQDRLQAEVASSNSVVPWLALVGAWSRKPCAGG